MCLDGNAREVLHDDFRDYDSIINRLQTRFGDHLLKKRFEIILPTRKRKSNEKLTELASDIRYMTNIVYEDLSPSTREKMAVKHFIMAIESPAAQYELSQRNDETLDSILEAALLREMYFGEERPWKNSASSFIPNASRTKATSHIPRCRHCGGDHFSYICQPCRFCNGAHYDNKCPQRAGNEKPMEGRPTNMGDNSQGQ